MNKTIITVIGRDKPGIIASVSETLFKLNCNIENISQTILQSEFAGIYIVSIPKDLQLDSLNKELQSDLGDKHLQVHTKPLEEKEAKKKDHAIEPFIVTTSGPDRKGLVAVFSRVIADSGINISNLKAVFEGGDNPERNITIYELEVPSNTDLQKFAEKLKNKASEVNLDLTIQHKNIFDKVNRI